MKTVLLLAPDALGQISKHDIKLGLLTRVDEVNLYWRCVSCSTRRIADTSGYESPN